MALASAAALEALRLTGAARATAVVWRVTLGPEARVVVVVVVVLAGAAPPPGRAASGVVAWACATWSAAGVGAVAVEETVLVAAPGEPGVSCATPVLCDWVYYQPAAATPPSRMTPAATITGAVLLFARVAPA